MYYCLLEDIVENVRQIPTKLNKLNWIVPACFGCSCALLAAAISLLMVRGFDNMEHSWLFSIGADLFCMAVCVMLCFSCVLNFKRRNEHTRVFVGLLTTTANIASANIIVATILPNNIFCFVLNFFHHSKI